MNGMYLFKADTSEENIAIVQDKCGYSTDESLEIKPEYLDQCIECDPNISKEEDGHDK